MCTELDAAALRWRYASDRLLSVLAYWPLPALDTIRTSASDELLYVRPWLTTRTAVSIQVQRRQQGRTRSTKGAKPDSLDHNAT